MHNIYIYLYIHTHTYMYKLSVIKKILEQNLFTNILTTAILLI